MLIHHSILSYTYEYVSIAFTRGRVVELELDVLSQESFEQVQSINHLTTRVFEAGDRIRAVRMKRLLLCYMSSSHLLFPLTITHMRCYCCEASREAGLLGSHYGTRRGGYAVRRPAMFGWQQPFGGQFRCSPGLLPVCVRVRRYLSQRSTLYR